MLNVVSALSSTNTSWSFTFTSQNIYNTPSTCSLPQFITTSFNASISSADYVSSATMKLGQNQVNVNYYLGIYVLIGLLAALFGTLRTYYMFMGSLAASRKLHEAML